MTNRSLIHEDFVLIDTSQASRVGQSPRRAVPTYAFTPQPVRPKAALPAMARRAPERSVLGYVSTGAQEKRRWRIGSRPVLTGQNLLNGYIRAVVFLSFVGGMGLACQRRLAQDGEPHRAAPAGSAQPTVRLSDPEKIRFTPEVLATGNLKPQQSAQLAMPVPGTLLRVFVKRGQEVKAGETLAVLDAAAARASLAQSEAGIAAAEAQLRLADDALTRTTGMRKDEVVPESQFIQVKGQRDLAAAQLQAAQAQTEQARVLLKNHTLTAPFGGVVIRVPDGTGMPVGPQAPLFAIEDVRALVLETSLTQMEAAELPAKATATVVIPATGARVENATVRLVVPSVDIATNRVPIEIAVPNQGGAVLPHAFARAHLSSGEARDAYRVRQAALTQREGEFSVWAAGPDGKARALRVRVLGHLQDDFAVVDFGSTEFPVGCRIVDAPPLGIVEGTKLSEDRRP